MRPSNSFCGNMRFTKQLLFQKYSPLCSWCSYWSHSPIFVDLHIGWWQKTKYRKTTKYWWKSWWLTKYPKRDLKAGRSKIFRSICLSRCRSRGRAEMFTSSWTWRTVVEPSCLGTRISSKWFLGFLFDKSPHRETLLRPIYGHLLVLIALLAALSHPGHRVRHSETSRQLRRCRQWGPFNEDVSSKRAVFNAIWSIYRLMAAPASPIAPAQEEIVHRRAVRRNTVYTDPLAQSIFQPNYLELNFISHFKFFSQGVQQLLNWSDIVTLCVHLYLEQL